jgi:hypothetical protein
MNCDYDLQSNLTLAFLANPCGNTGGKPLSFDIISAQKVNIYIRGNQANR